jgi:hypothetical protein
MNILACPRRAGTLAMAAAAALALSPLPSLAHSASASMTDISLSVVDLDLTDGITAGFSFLEGVSSAAVNLNATANSGVPNDNRGVFQGGLTNPFIPLSSSLTLLGAQVSGATTSSSLMVSGSSSGLIGFSGETEFSIGDQSNDRPVFGIRLTPATRLVVEADYHLLANAVEGACEFNCMAEASISLQREGSDRRTHFDQAIAAIDAAGVEHDEKSGSFLLGLDGFDDRTADVRLLFVTRASGFPGSQPPPIPEPQTYALMLLGLGALGLVSRRRQRR